MEKKENLKVLIIPDVHGRDFWRNPLKETLEKTNSRVIFLGDYLDPYPYEWKDAMDGDSPIDYQQKAFDNFKEIIEIKKQYKHRITLLLGNHDCGYAVSQSVCECRRDRKRYGEIEKIFDNNRELFQLADEETIDRKHFIFSHAGIGISYAEFCFGNMVNENNVVDLFNNAWLTNNYGIMGSLEIYDHFRGWGGHSYGSLVWADAREWGDSEGDQHGYGYMIFGHTQMESEPYVSDRFACLDVRKAFYLDNSGNIRDYETDNIVTKK